MPSVDPGAPVKTVKGAWWDSERPELRASGELRIAADGHIKLVLETIALRSAEELPGFEEKFESRTFWGHDQHGHAWSLFGCVWAGSQSSVARVEHRRSVSHAVLGVHRASLDEVQFDEIEVDFTDLQEWLCTPLLREREPRQPGAINVVVPPLDPREFPMKRGFTVALRPSVGGGSSYSEISFTIRQALALKFSTPATLRDLSEILLDLQWFLTLGQGETVRVLEVTGLRQGVRLRGTDAPQIIEVFHRWAGGQAPRRSLHRHEMLFTAEDIGPQFGAMLDRWHDYRQSHAAVLSCYFATRFNESLYSNHAFLFLAHGLELYHQLNFPGNRQAPDEFRARLDAIVAAVPTEGKWLRERLATANRLTLAERLRVLLEAKKDLIGGFIANPDQFVAAVKDTRNYYTHYDEKLKDSGRVASGVALLKLIVQMQGLLEACFLLDLGAPQKAISAVLKDGRTYVAAP